MGSNQNPVTILIADDDPDDRLMLQEALLECGLPNPLCFAANGEEVMEILQRSLGAGCGARGPLPGLLLLDLNMPRKDGREVLREIRAQPAFSSLTVVMLSTSKSDDDLAWARREGVPFHSKPASFAGLRDLVGTIARDTLPGSDGCRPDGTELAT